MYKKIILVILITILSFGSVSAGGIVCDDSINNFPKYKEKIDILYEKLSFKEKNIREKFYNKINKITDVYLYEKDLINKKNTKLYAIISYIKCESKNLLRPDVFNKELGLGKILENIEKNVKKYKFVYLEKHNDKILFSGPKVAAVSDLYNIKMSDLEKIIGYKIKGLNKFNFGDDGFGLLSVEKRGNYLFLEMQANLAGGSYKFYFVLDNNLELRKYRGVEFIGNKVYLLNRECNLHIKTEILDLNSKKFLTKIVNGLKWGVKGYIGSQLIVVYDGNKKYGLIGENKLFDIENEKIINIEENSNFVFFGEKQSTLNYNHKFYYIKKFKKNDEKRSCTISEIKVKNNRIILGKEKKGYCPTIGFFNIGFSEIYNGNIWTILEYYRLIEEQRLSEALSYKYFIKLQNETEENYLKRYSIFKSTFYKNYIFNEKVEINVENIKETGKNKFNYNVIIKYESGKIEKYNVSSELIDSGLLGNIIKTLSVKKY